MNAQFRFDTCNSIAQAEDALNAILPAGTDWDEVVSLFRNCGAELRAHHGGLFVSYSEKNHHPGLLGLANVRVDWNCSCGFDDSGKLTNLAINRGLTGL
jgi:hypothetical protein